jgi:hypothetical protein
VLDDASLSLVVQRMPSLLQCNVETNMEPTVRFYEECVGVDAARMHLANYPSLCGASVEHRLQPRLAELLAAGNPMDTGTISLMAKTADNQWANSMSFQKTILLKEQLLDR